MCHPDHKSAKIKGLTRSDRPYANELIGHFIGQQLDDFLPKNWYVEKATSSKIQGMSKVWKVHAACCMQLARNRLPHIRGVEGNKKIFKQIHKVTHVYLPCGRCQRLCTHTLIEWSYCHNMHTQISYCSAEASSLSNLKQV